MNERGGQGRFQDEKSKYMVNLGLKANLWLTTWVNGGRIINTTTGIPACRTDIKLTRLKGGLTAESKCACT